MAGAIRVIDGIKYKQVEREAMEGERIIITDAMGTMGMYTDGDVLIVRKSDSLGVEVPEVATIGNIEGFIEHSEYHVLEPVDAVNANLLGVIADLTACVAKLTEEVRELRKNQ